LQFKYTNLLILSMLLFTGCEKDSTSTNLSSLVGNWSTSSALYYDNESCTGVSEDALAGTYWTSSITVMECSATHCTKLTNHTCSGCDGNSAPGCCNYYEEGYIHTSGSLCQEFNHSLTGNIVALSADSYCDDDDVVDCGTYLDQETCEAAGNDWDTAFTMNGTSSGNSIIITDISEGGCSDDSDVNQADCEAGGLSWSSGECIVITFTKQ